MKRKFVWLVIFLFALLLLVRILYPTADAPGSLSTSAGAYLDESSTGHNARNKALYGRWVTDEWNPFIYSPLFTLLQYINFSLLGVSFFSQHLLPILLSWLSLILFYFGLKEYFNRRTALLALVLLGFNYFFIMFNRLALFENLVVFFAAATFYFFQRGLRQTNKKIPHFVRHYQNNVIIRLDRIIQNWIPRLNRGMTEKGVYNFLYGKIWFLFAGIAAFLTLTSKGMSAHYFVLACFITLLFYPPRKKNISFFLTGLILIGTIWLFFFYLPCRGWIGHYSQRWLNHIVPGSLKIALFNILSQPFFYRLRWMMFSVILAFLYLGALFFNLIKGRRVEPLDFFTAAWFLLGAFSTGLLSYEATRYYLPFVPALSILAARGLIQIKEQEKINVASLKDRRLLLIIFAIVFIFFQFIVIPFLLNDLFSSRSPALVLPAKIKASLLAAGAITVLFFLLTKFLKRKKVFVFPLPLRKVIFSLSIILFFCVNLFLYFGWAKNRSYTLKAASVDIGRRLNNALIAGQGIIAFCVENEHRPLHTKTGWFNERDIFKKFPVTHLLLTDYAGILKGFQQRYPEVMEKARLIKVYRVIKYRFRLYALNDAPLTLSSEIVHEAENLSSCLGKKVYDIQCSGCLARYANPWLRTEGHLTYGPYASCNPGKYEVIFRLKTNKPTDKKVAVLDVATDKSRKILSRMVIRGTDFKKIGNYENFCLPLLLAQPIENLEFRVYFCDTAELWVDKITLRPAGK